METIGTWTRSQLTKFIRSLPPDTFARPRKSSDEELMRIRRDLQAATTVDDVKAQLTKLIDLTLNP